jgi:hypothetical protein
MRLRLSATTLVVVGCGLVVALGCVDILEKLDESCPGGIGLGDPPCDCMSWTWRLSPFSTDYEDIPALEPDWSTSPPLADVTVGRRFQVVLSAVDTRPGACNQGYGGGTVRSTDPSVLAFESKGNHHSWSIFVGVAPGRASLEAVGLRTPSGGRETAPLTVCSEPNIPSETCTNRIPLVIRVVP